MRILQFERVFYGWSLLKPKMVFGDIPPPRPPPPPQKKTVYAVKHICFKLH